jgi:hypothetical protein
MNAQELFDEFTKLDYKEKIKFELLKNLYDKEYLENLEDKKMTIAEDLASAGISNEWIVKNILDL